MPIPLKTLNRLRYGKPVAAEVATTNPDTQAFIMVIPRVPSPHTFPEAYIDRGDREKRHILRDPSFIKGYEIRYLKHGRKYTATEWGWDYDYVLDDETTRVKRIFIEREEEIEQAIAPWLSDAAQLQAPHHFDSSLVDSPIDGYLNQPDERPHLWREE